MIDKMIDKMIDGWWLMLVDKIRYDKSDQSTHKYIHNYSLLGKCWQRWLKVQEIGRWEHLTEPNNEQTLFYPIFYQ